MSYQKLVHGATVRPNNAVFDKTNTGGSIYYVARSELRSKYNVPEAEIDKIINKMVERLKSGPAVLEIPASPVLPGAPLMYVPEVKAFICFYIW